MNRRGFTLVELLAVLVILGIVVGITIVSINSSLSNAKDKSEEVFIGTIKDALEMYLDSSQAKGLTKRIVGEVAKTYGNVNLYKLYGLDENNNETNITFKEVFASDYNPLTEKDFVNPKNEKQCNTDAVVNIYRDSEHVYYYCFKGNIGCLTEDCVISNSEFVISKENGGCK